MSPTPYRAADIALEIGGKPFEVTSIAYYGTRVYPTRPQHYVCQHCSKVVPDGLPRMRHHGFVICAVCAVDTGLATVAEVAKWTGTVVAPDGTVTVTFDAVTPAPVTVSAWAEPSEGD